MSTAGGSTVRRSRRSIRRSARRICGPPSRVRTRTGCTSFVAARRTMCPTGTCAASPPRGRAWTRWMAPATSYTSTGRRSCWTGSCRASREEGDMAIRDADLERLREQVAVTIGRGTDLLAALNALDDGLAALMPALARLPEAERLADL